MKLRDLILIVPIGLLACGGDAPDTTADVAAIRAFIDNATDINNAGDIAGWVDLFAEDMVFMPDGQPAITTRDALEGSAVSHFSRYRPNIRITADEIQIMGDWAFARTTVTGTLTPHGNGNPLQVDRKEIAVYRRQTDGRWKLARLIANSSR
jgi:uncharacterized protein (TIGR02246 family)